MTAWRWWHDKRGLDYAHVAFGVYVGDIKFGDDDSLDRFIEQSKTRGTVSLVIIDDLEHCLVGLPPSKLSAIYEAETRIRNELDCSLLLLATDYAVSEAYWQLEGSVDAQFQITGNSRTMKFVMDKQRSGPRLQPINLRYRKRALPLPRCA